MDPEHMKWINEVQNGRFLFCPNGSHLRSMMIQNFPGVIKFLKDVDDGSFKTS
jgi:proline iminopeptidase